VNARIALAERSQEVREAARDWGAEGLIDAVALAAIEAAHPDDRRRLSPSFRALAFAATGIAVAAAFYLLVVLMDLDGARAFRGLALFFGAALGAASEYLRGPLRLMRAGTETATALAAGLFLQMGLAVTLFGDDPWSEEEPLRMLLLLGILVFGALAWRHGSATAAAVAAGQLAALLARFPASRWSWTLAAMALIPLSAQGGSAARLSPSQRRACTVVLVMALVGLYAAWHVLSWDFQLFESGFSGRFQGAIYGEGQRGLLRGLFIAATALLPLAMIAWGTASRRRVILNAGILLAAASLATVRYYVHLAPLWLNLCAFGILLIGLALGVRRWLERGAAGERHGWTARALLGGSASRRLAETAVALAVAAPQPVPEAEPGFSGEGGRSGGAGASGDW